MNSAVILPLLFLLGASAAMPGVEDDFDYFVNNPQSRPLLNAPAGLSVVRHPDQKTRWDFPAIVGKYRSSMSAEERRKWESLDE